MSCDRPLDASPQQHCILRALLGGHVTLYPHADGYLNAEVTGEYSGLIKMCGFAGKMGLVAGEGFEPSTFGL